MTGAQPGGRRSSYRAVSRDREGRGREGAVTPLVPPGSISSFTIVKSVVTNPVVAMTLLGITWNRALGARIPALVDEVLSSFGDLFPVCAIYLLGVNMYNSFSFRASGAEGLATYSVLGLFKIVVLPVVCYFLTLALTQDFDLAMFSFILGAMPMAPTVSIYAFRYSTLEKNYVSEASCPRGLVHGSCVAGTRQTLIEANLRL
jgi:malonate transporter and related proteins